MEGEKKFDCTDCIAFCCSNVYAVTLTGVEVARLSLRLSLTPQEFRRRYTVDGHTLRQKEDAIFEKACIFLDPTARRCTVYSSRPEVCRVWPRPEDAAPGAAGRCGFYDLYTHLRNELEPNVVPLFQLVRAVDSQHTATQPNPARATAVVQEGSDQCESLNQRTVTKN